VADHILTESGDRIQAETGDFLVLALDLLGEPIFIAVARGRRRSFASPSPSRTLAARAPRRVFASEGGG
jgi:hypothetical protein